MKHELILIFTFLFCLLGCKKNNNLQLDEAERLLLHKPDSALYILKQIQPASLNPKDYARYALMYSEALDKNNIKITDDSLILQAWNYYKNSSHDMANQCKTLFYRGKIKLNANNQLEALRLFLIIDEMLERTSEPNYKGLGLLHKQIGKVYYEQMNYNRAFLYFQQSRDFLQKANASTEEIYAILDMASATYRMKNISKAIKLYSTALHLSDEQNIKETAQTAMNNLSSLYVITDRKNIPPALLERIEKYARNDSLYKYQTLMNINVIRNNIDSARHYLNLAESHSNNPFDMAYLQYVAFKINTQTEQLQDAIDRIHRYITLTDSLTRSEIQFSAGMVEREYLKKQAELAKYRMEIRNFWEIIISVFIVVSIITTCFIIRRFIHIQRERTNHYLLLSEKASIEYKRLTDNLIERQDMESRLKGLVASRFELIEKLGRKYYEKENTAIQQTNMFQQVKQIILEFSENPKMRQELETIVNLCHDNAMMKLKNDFPSMKESDIQLLCYIFAGFSPQVISLFMKNNITNVYTRKSRLKLQIKSSDSDNKELFLKLL